MTFAQEAAAGSGGVPWAVIVPALAATAAAILSFVAARRSDKNATSSRTIELGVTELVNQLRTERAHLENEVHDCKGECAELRNKVEVLEEQIEETRLINERLITELDNKESEIIRLRIKAGEITP